MILNNINFEFFPLNKGDTFNVTSYPWLGGCVGWGSILLVKHDDKYHLVLDLPRQFLFEFKILISAGKNKEDRFASNCAGIYHVLQYSPLFNWKFEFELMILDYRELVVDFLRFQLCFSYFCCDK